MLIHSGIEYCVLRITAGRFGVCRSSVATRHRLWNRCVVLRRKYWNETSRSTQCGAAISRSDGRSFRLPLSCSSPVSSRPRRRHRINDGPTNFNISRSVVRLTDRLGRCLERGTGDLLSTAGAPDLTSACTIDTKLISSTSMNSY